MKEEGGKTEDCKNSLATKGFDAGINFVAK